VTGARRIVPVAWLGALVVVAACARAACGLEPDAATVGRAGAALLHRLEASPGAVHVRVPCVGIDGRWIDRAAGIEAMAVRGAWGEGGVRVAASCDRVRSPVHIDAGCSAGAQLRRGAVAAGAAVEWRRLHFASGARLSRARLRLGAGAQHAGLAAAGVVELRTAIEPPRLAFAVELAPAPGLACVSELERRTGQATNARCGLEVGSGALRIWCGYETATAAGAWGAALQRGGLRIAGAARIHPQLGWSPMWSCEWRP
jgi:hypothetical protein